MRQTNGALTMLLAQYRAIYMNALIICFAGSLSAGAILTPSIAIAAPAVVAAATPQNIDGNFDGKLEDGITYNSKNENLIDLQKDLTQQENTSNTFDASPNKINLKTKNITLQGITSLKASANKSVSFDLSNGENKKGTFTGNNTGELIFLENGSLELSNANVQLDSFKDIKATSENTKITLGENTNTTINKANLDSYLNTANVKENKQGQIILGVTGKNNKSSLEITNIGEEGLVLNNYIGAEGTAGKIAVKEENTIKADHVIFESKIDDSAKDKINLEAKKLVIGKNDSNLTDKVNFKSATISDSLEFRSKDAGVDAKDVYTLKALDNAEHTLSGKVKLGNGGKLDFQEGNWTVSDDVTISGGSLKVVADANKSVNVTFNNNTLTFDSDNEPNLEVGKDSSGISTLDLTKATITGGDKSKVTVNGNGTLKVTASGFTELQKGKLSVNSGAKDVATLEIVDGEITLNDDNTKKGKVDLNGKVIGQSLALGPDSKGPIKKAGPEAPQVAGPNDGDVTINLGDKANLTFSDVKANGKKITIDKGTLTANQSLTANSSDKSLTLDVKELNLGTDKNSHGTISANELIIDKADSNTAINGTWTATNTDITLKNGNLNLKDGSLNGVHKLTLGSGTESTKKLQAVAQAPQPPQAPASNSKLTIDNADLIVDKIDLKGEITLNGGSLTVNGIKKEEVNPPKPEPQKPQNKAPDGDSEKPQADADVVIDSSSKITANTNSHVTFGRETIDDLYDATTKELTEAGKNLATTYYGNSNAVLNLDFGKDTVLSVEDASKLSQKFEHNKGFINLGDASLDTPIQGNSAKWDDVKDLASLQVTNNNLENIKVEATSDNVAQGIYGDFGSFAITSKDGTTASQDITVGKSTILNNASGNGNSFVTVDGKTANLKLQDNSSLTLANGGNIGVIKTSGTGSETSVSVVGGTTNIDSLEGSEKTDVSFANTNTSIKDKLKGNNLDIKNASLKVGGSTEVNSLDLTNTNATFNDITVKNTTDAVNILGGSVNAKNVTINSTTDTIIANDAIVNIEGSLTSKGKLKLGYKEITPDNTPQVAMFKAAVDAPENLVKNSSARMYVKDGSKFTNDIDVVSGTTQASLIAFGDTNANKNIKVGANSAIVYGADGDLGNVEAIESYLKDNYLQAENGSIKGNKALAVFNKATTVSQDKVINLNSNSKETSGILLGENSTIVVTDKALADKTKPAVTISNSGKLHFDKNDYNEKAYITLTGVSAFGKDQNASNDLKVFDSSALANIDTKKGLRVEAANGQLYGTINQNGNLEELKLDITKVNNINYMASEPVVPYIGHVLSNIKNNKFFDQSQTDMNKLALDLAYGNDHGRAMEVASRFAVYGQNFKTTELAVGDFNNVLQNFLNNDGTIIRSDDFEGVGLFVSPTYRKSKISSLENQGQSYGGDVDITNLVLGANFDLNYKLKLGAMFSLGQGDAKGSGIASGVDADSDVYGGSLYASFADKGLQVTADLTHVRAKSDVSTNFEGSDKFNKFTADVKSQATSVGLNGAYVFLLDDEGKTYLKPHLGVRYTKYDIDDYSVNANGQSFMQNKFDSAHILSVPLGFVLGTEIQQKGFILKPSVDLGINFNTDDTDMKSYAKLTNDLGNGINLSSEVVDSVVFGVKANVNAQFNNNLSVGVGLGYEQGSSTKNLGVNAGFNYSF